MLNIPQEKLRVVPLGVSGEFHPVEDHSRLQRAREELGLPLHYILFAGNLEPKKNLPALIEAYAQMRRSGRITHHLVIAGRNAWQYADVFRTVRRLHIGEIVHFPGRVPLRLLPALYSGADLFVFPSIYEGFGLPPLEAMACGTPVVASTAGALREVLGNAALTVMPDSGRELCSAMEKVLTNQFLAGKLRDLGLKHAKNFTWTRTARMTAAVYDEVLSSTTGA